MNSNAPPNRLQLNFGFDRNNNYGTGNDGRQFPTTPSTFPQPVFPNSQGQQEVWGAQNTNNGYAGTSYFMNNQYQQQGGQQQQQAQQQQQQYQQGQAQQAQQQQQQQQQGSQQQGQAYRSPGGYNDGTNGLVHQFSHQNLGGGTPRSGSPYGRQPSPATQRPRTAGANPQQQYGNFLSPQVPLPNNSMNDEEPPQKNPEKFSEHILRKSKVSTGLVSTFFKDSVQRARDRNARYGNGNVQ
jgi:protein-serine/threonine kinase